jgi:hypothetical protein
VIMRILLAIRVWASTSLLALAFEAERLAFRMAEPCGSRGRSQGRAPAPQRAQGRFPHEHGEESPLEAPAQSGDYPEMVRA